MRQLPHEPDTLSDTQLLRELVADVALLLRRQLALLQLETRSQLSQTKKTAGLLAAAGVIAIAGLVLLLVAASLGLGVAWSGRFWLGALVVASVLLLVGGSLGLWGWRARIRRPLHRSRREIEKEAKWARGLLSQEAP